MKRGAILLLVMIFVFGLAVGRAAAQGDDPPATPSPNEVNAIARNLYCPVCANVPLDVCGTAACAQWRKQIADLLADGYSEQQVYDFFSAQYGQGVLAAPPARGLNWLIYVLPPAAILVGAFLLWRNMNKWKQAPAKIAGKTHRDKYSQQIEDELKARR
jgi:cytochrome c-type biogenesis protein CcmH